MTVTKEQHRKLINKKRLEKIKSRKKYIQQKQKEETEKIYNREKYPPTIRTMIKRIKRIDPWNTVASLNHLDSSLVVYYKLKQKGIENVRIVKAPNHSWVEFQFNENWYILDVKAVQDTSLGDPIKLKNEVTNPVYNTLSRYYEDVDEFYSRFENDFSLEKEEAQIEAMEDEGLNTFLIIKYH